MWNVKQEGFAINVVLGETSDPGWGRRVLEDIIVLTLSAGSTEGAKEESREEQGGKV